MSWTGALLRLQEIDLELQDMNQRLTEIEADLRDQTQLLDARQKAEQFAAEAKTTHQVQKELEFELNTVQVDLQQTDHNLYSGAITNSRELRDLQAKSQSLQRRVVKLEDDLLDAMMAREEADEVAATATAHLKTISERREEHCNDLKIERDKLRNLGQILLKEVAGLKTIIPPQVMDSYHYLKTRTGGIPVAHLEGGVCSMCGMEVLKPTQRKVRNGEEAFCDGCHRLLVV